jgi:hypothetical protein
MVQAENKMPAKSWANKGALDFLGQPWPARQLFICLLMQYENGLLFNKTMW